MNVRIFWVRAMKCMCAQTRPRFILSSERVFWGMEFEPMLTPREKSPLPENFPRGGSNPRCCGQRAQTLPTSYSGSPACSFEKKKRKKDGFWERRRSNDNMKTIEFPTLTCRYINQGFWKGMKLKINLNGKMGEENRSQQATIWHHRCSRQDIVWVSEERKKCRLLF